MSANPFADWSSHVFPVGRSEYILSTNTATLYSVVFSARSIKGEGAFRSNMLAQLRATMMEDGFEFHYKRLVDVEADAPNYSKALSRRLIGSMNDMAELACYSLEVQKKTPEQVTRMINDTPFSVIDGSGPRDAFGHMNFRG